MATQIVLPSIEGYRVNRLIGMGGMAVVYHATHERLGRNVAIKLMLPAISSKKRSVQRFLQEAEMAARIVHPNVVIVFDCGMTGDRPFMAMELLEGGDCLKFLKDSGGKLDEITALTLIRDAARGVAAVHRSGVVHRDIKPQNILLTIDGIAKVADLGLAVQAEEGDSISRANATIGTPAYMSPEQAEGTHHVDGLTDIYALGATLYSLTTGRAPFTGDKPWLVLTKVLQEHPVDARTLGVSDIVATIIDRAMAKDPTRRYQNTDEMIEVLEAATFALAGGRRPITTLQKAKPEKSAVTEADEIFESISSNSSRTSSHASATQHVRPTERRGKTESMQGVVGRVLRSEVEPDNAARFPSALRRGEVFGLWRIQSVHLRTNASITYRVVEVESQRTLLLAIFTDSASQVEAWHKDLSTRLTGLEHPHLTRLDRSGVIDGRAFLVFELERAATVRDVVVDQGALDFDTAIRIACQVADGLRALEKAGVQHRILEPGNLWVDAEGIARLGPVCIDPPDAQRSIMGRDDPATALVTACQSPELAVGATKVRVQSDIYSLGASLFFMLTGHAPFEDSDFLELTLKVISGNVPDLATVLPGLSDKFYTFFRTLLAKDENARPANAAAVILGLNRVSLGLPIKQDLIRIAKTKRVYPGSLEDLITVMQFLEDTDPDRAELAKAASCIALCDPQLPVWKAMKKLKGSTWHERKASHMVEILESARVPETPPQIFHIGKDFSTLAQALQSAPPYAFLLVPPGEHPVGHVLKKPITIIGQGSAKSVILVPAEANHLLQCASDGIVLSNLSIHVRAASDGARRLGLDIVKGRPCILSCHITSDSLSPITIHGIDANPFIADCRIQAPKSSGIFCYDQAKGQIENCEIAQCLQAGVEAAKGAQPLLRNLAISGGLAAGIMVWQEAKVRVERCAISTNKLSGIEIRAKGQVDMSLCRIHSGHHCGILAHEDAIVKADNCEIAQNQHPALAVKGGAQVHLIDCGILKGYRSGVLILEGGSATMERCRIIGNMGTGLEIRSGGRLHLTHSQVDYGGTIGVSAAAGAVGIISDSQFTGSDPMQAVKLEKGAKVAVEGIRST